MDYNLKVGSFEEHKKQTLVIFKRQTEFITLINIYTIQFVFNSSTQLLNVKLLIRRYLPYKNLILILLRKVMHKIH